jgi:hypothetical protein
MTKEEIIAKAYGINYNKLKEYINNDGWCRSFPSTQNQIDYINTGLQNVAWRPKSLQGIETNNGWIKIESDEWLKEHKISGSITKYYVDNANEDYLTISVLAELSGEKIQLTLDSYLWLKHNAEIVATHYQPIVKPLNPIY